MGGYPCYKLLLCGGNGGAAVQALMQIGVEKSDAGTLTDSEFKQVVAFFEYVEETGNALAKKLSGTPTS